MPDQDTSPQPQPGAAKPATPRVSNKLQIQLMRKALRSEILGLKKQVLMIQAQSFGIMKRSMESYFQNQAAGATRQLVKQEQIAQEQAAQVWESAAKEVQPDPGTQSAPVAKKRTTPAQQAHYNASLKALQEAQKSVDNAIKAANISIQEAEKLLKGIK